MSTGPRAASAFNLETQSKVEEDDSHSALFFLFQEVSKLASPASNTIPPSKLLNEASMNNNFITRKDDGGEHSFQPCYSSCQHELPCVWTYNHLKNVRHNSKGSKSGTSAEQRCESNSPLKVLSLINLHCEKLLQKKDVEEFGYTSATLASAAPDVTDVGIKRDNVEYASGPYLHLCEKQEIIASVSPVDDVLGSCLGGGYKQEGCLKIPEGVFRLQQQTEKLDSVRIEIQEDNKTSSLLPPLRDERRRRGHETTRLKQEVTFSVSQLKWNGDVLSVPPHENTLQQTHNLDTCLNTQQIFNSNDKVCKEASKPALILDHNANIGLYSKPPCNIQLSSVSTILPSPQSAPQLSDTAESSPFHSESENKSTAAELGSASAYVEEKSPQAAQLNSSVCEVSSAKSEPELSTVNEEKTDLLSTRRWKTKTPRKQPHPSRSADIQDPNFQGVTFRMDTELDDTKEQCRLLITSKYSKELCKSVRRPRLRTRMLQKSHKTSSSDEEGDLTANVLRSKICASCCTRKTPMWRDAEDGTPLCNACGIRYKKYRVRCVNCWHIPRKEGNSNSRCLKCGNFVRLTSAQRKQTT